MPKHISNSALCEKRLEAPDLNHRTIVPSCFDAWMSALRDDLASVLYVAVTGCFRLKYYLRLFCCFLIRKQRATTFVRLMSRRTSLRRTRARFRYEYEISIAHDRPSVLAVRTWQVMTRVRTYEMTNVQRNILIYRYDL